MMHTGIFRATSAESLLALLTTPTVVAVPTLSMSGSLLLISSTESSADDPTTRSRSTVFMLKSCATFGSSPGRPMTLPVSPSDFVMAASSPVPMAMRPPGRTLSTLLPPASSEVIFAVILS